MNVVCGYSTNCGFQTCTHTGSLEVYHSSMLKYAEKRLHFKYKTMRAHTQLAIMDHNANIGRPHTTTRKCESSTDQDANTCSGSGIVPSTSAVPPCQPQASTPISPISETADKTMKMPDPPEYVVYTDSELDMVRSQYFALLHNGKEKDCKIRSKELCCRLIRNTVTSMVAILCASPMGKEVKYPSKREMRAMAQKIADYYPMKSDDNTQMPHPGEDPRLYLEKWPLSSPVLLFDGTTSIVAVGNRPVSNLPQEDFWEGMLVLMAFYTLYLTYPKCVATVLSVIQTEVIGDAIHDQDTTGAYKKAIAEWKSFIEK
ncbi:hypothetical protein ABVT39_013856 [Epinephelus coioides]